MTETIDPLVIIAVYTGIMTDCGFAAIQDFVGFTVDDVSIMTFGTAHVARSEQMRAYLRENVPNVVNFTPYFPILDEDGKVNNSEFLKWQSEQVRILGDKSIILANGGLSGIAPNDFVDAKFTFYNS